jgi:uncharacterized repeat protein (TIGR01451 family)
MKNVKTVLILAFFALAVAVPVLKTSMAQAEQVSLLCSYNSNVEIESYHTTSEGCDLGIIKQVSINGGSYVDADTAGAAAAAQVGDSVTWKIFITNNSDQGNTPFGIVTVHDVLPAGVTAGDATANTGTYSNGDWVFTLGQKAAPSLIINSTAATVGLVKNTATFTDYNPNNCDGECVDPPYFDSNNDNNTNDAFVNIAAVPVVPAPVTHVKPVTPVLVNTGQNPLFAMMAAFGLATAAVIVFNYDKVKAELTKFAQPRN